MLTRKEFEALVLLSEKQEALSQREIANLLGISRSYVSRNEKKALEKLNTALEKP